MSSTRVNPELNRLWVHAALAMQSLVSRIPWPIGRCSVERINNMTDTPMTASELNAAIAELPPELQIRVNVIAEMLRGALANDVKFETELAIWLVQSEISEDEAASTVPAELGNGERLQ